MENLLMYSTFACAASIKHAASYVNYILLTHYAAAQLKDTIVLMNDPKSMSQIQIQIQNCSRE